MAIPLLAYAPTTQNARVDGFDVANDDQARIFSTENLLSDTDLDVLIEAAYRQIVFHAFASDREPFLESQLRNGQITVREFIRGLCLANTFTQSFYNLNSNYKFVEHCVNRLLGRSISGQEEKIAWSIVVATKGRAGFIDALLDSDEYLDNFGDHTVPYQRRRVLASSNTANIPFNIENPRYDAYMRRKLGFPKYVFAGTAVAKSFKGGDDKFQAGSPANFLDMARSISMGGGGPVSNAFDVDFVNGVPYRKNA
ncbi:phycobilisome rod-core linker polypeptide [filamentous cyanobacterium LEGE 11480]|uniref:Phycobilisome rod-core linker polypeptide n=1 Tax=Romeriopsis navalis LEGE 11480 TaxID=2777977 RepID=A0A928Z2Q2_9CYAN|nr:phycobilisome rod-core linker polypeptide [Romeriopsis navalis]MBE9029779.1 phycobilisome rod-core linker polypeptide [Romeriopsis navalis LEGE 11480]